MNTSKSYKLISGKTSLFFVFFIAVLNIFSTGISGGEEPNTVKKDTVRALVMYGDKFLFERVDYMSEDAVIRFRDSLLMMPRPPLHLVKEIHLYLSIKKMSDDEIVHLIDSLFEQEIIPYPLVNQINLYVANRGAKMEENIFYSEEDTSMYPADGFYQSWNTSVPHPYTNGLVGGDSVLNLALKGSEKLGDYMHPIKPRLRSFEEKKDSLWLGILTSDFGWREGCNHNGVDIDLEVWDTVTSAFPGMVRVAGSFGGYGRVIVIRHYNGLETLYAHLHRIKVKPGQTVKAGDFIGLGGSSGKSTGSHLHFECRFKGLPLNPQNFISFSEKKLLCDTITLTKTQWGYAAFPKGTEFHIVQRGDFLSKIATKYGTTTSRLCELNGIKSKKKRLVVGEKLRVM